jgi:DNA-binding FadR family transcriptional regulator
MSQPRADGVSVTYSRRGLHGDVVDALGKKIVQGELSPGEVIDLDALERQLDVSRTVLREAIRVLGAKGLVDARPKHGTFVRERRYWSLLDPDVMGWQSRRDVDAGLLMDLEEVRRIVEPQAARLAAQRRGQADLAAMHEALEMLFSATTETGDSTSEYVDADVAFHHAILVATRNEILLQLTTALEHALRLRDALVYQSMAHPDHARAIGAHRAVLEAIEAGDDDRAEAQARALLAGSRSDLESALRDAGRSRRKRR